MSENLKKAAQEVVDAWVVTGPDVVGHLTEKSRLKGRWPSLGAALDRLAELLDTGWEYNIEENDTRQGRKRLVCLEWKGSPDDLTDYLRRLRKNEDDLASYGTSEIKVWFKIVKRRRPEGYVDA
jgi:hypothetical protein